MAHQETRSPPTTDGTFRLFDLPAELQLRIFELAVTREEPIRITYHAWVEKHHPGEFNSFRLHLSEWSSEASKEQRTQPALTRTCKVIREDSLKFYYRNNTFKAGICETHSRERKTTLAWLTNIGEANMREIGNLIVCDPYGDWEDGGMSADLIEEVDECLIMAKEIFAEKWNATLEKVAGGGLFDRKVIFQSSSEDKEP